MFSIVMTREGKKARLQGKKGKEWNRYSVRSRDGRQGMGAFESKVNISGSPLYGHPECCEIPWVHVMTFAFTSVVSPLGAKGFRTIYCSKEAHLALAFELWCWRRLLRVPWTAGRSNQSILKEISPEYSLERLMLKLKLQYFGHLMWRADSFEKTLMLGKIEGRRKRWRQRMRWLNGITNSMDMSLINSRSWW